jgi:hypothetical protein
LCEAHKKECLKEESEAVDLGVVRTRDGRCLVSAQFVEFRIDFRSVRADEWSVESVWESPLLVRISDRHSSERKAECAASVAPGRFRPLKFAKTREFLGKTRLEEVRRGCKFSL